MGGAARAAGADSLDERGYHAWALEQAALLRAGRFAELDVANLVEEVEDRSGLGDRRGGAGGGAD